MPQVPPPSSVRCSGSRICSPSSFCSLISKRNTRRSEPDADPEERNPADIIESLASPSWRPQRLRPALANQRIRDTHTLDVHVPSRLRGEEITSGASSALLGVWELNNGLGVASGWPPHPPPTPLPLPPLIRPHFISSLIVVTGQNRPTLGDPKTFASGHNSAVCVLRGLFREVG